MLLFKTFFYLLHIEKYKTPVPKKPPENNNSNLHWWVLITRWSYSVSDTQDYIEYIIEKHKTLLIPLHIYINRTNNRLMFKTKGEYKQDLPTPKNIKILGSTKDFIDKTNNGENLPSFEVTV